MAEIYDNRICVFANELITLNPRRKVGSDKGFIPEGTFNSMRNRKQLLVLRRSVPGSSALVDFESMRPDIKNKYIQVYGDPRAEIAAKTQKSALEESIVYSGMAYEYFSVKYSYDNDKRLPPSKIDEYTLHIRIMDALLMLRDSRKTYSTGGGASRFNIWERLCKMSNELLTLKDPNGKPIFPHNLPQHWKALKRKCLQYESARSISPEEGFRSVIHKSYGNKNAAKIENEDCQAVMHKLISLHNNLNSVQIMEEYNKVATLMGWETISSPVTVDNWRKRVELTTLAGQRGNAALHNSKLKQIHREAPTQALTYWTLDGWTAELLYQKKTPRKVKGDDGKEKTYLYTTYTNRKTVVIVLDACCKYPVGYAIADNESPALIRHALRNAVNHTRELFGKRYKPLQLQSDNYQKKVMVPFYQAMTKYYTPAALKNAKSKIIEPYFKYINVQYCQKQANWSGFGITSNKANQPNLEAINTNHRAIPDEATVIAQIDAMILQERSKKIDAYRAAWTIAEESRKLPFGPEEYLMLMGETTGRTNHITGSGLYIELNGQRICYDSFDLSLRRHYNEDWIVRFDPDDMSQVLISNARRLRSGRVETELGTLRYLLQRDMKIPMALADQKPEHFEYRAQVDNFNHRLVEQVKDQVNRVDQRIEAIRQQVPQLIGNTMLDRYLIVDSLGQHKDARAKMQAEATESGFVQAVDQSLAPGTSTATAASADASVATATAASAAAVTVASSATPAAPAAVTVASSATSVVSTPAPAEEEDEDDYIYNPIDLHFSR